MNYEQKIYENGEWKSAYPKTTAEQVVTDDNHKFVTDAQIKEFGAKTQISVGKTQPEAPKEGAIWFDTSVPTSGAPSDTTETE